MLPQANFNLFQQPPPPLQQADRGADFGSNQFTLMANSFQSCAKPIISHPKPAQAQVKLAKVEKKHKGHPGADMIYNHTLKNAQTLRQSPYYSLRFWQHNCSTCHKHTC